MLCYQKVNNDKQSFHISCNFRVHVYRWPTLKVLDPYEFWPFSCFVESNHLYNVFPIRVDTGVAVEKICYCHTWLSSHTSRSEASLRQGSFQHKKSYGRNVPGATAVAFYWRLASQFWIKYFKHTDSTQLLSTKHLIYEFISWNISKINSEKLWNIVITCYKLNLSLQNINVLHISLKILNIYIAFQNVRLFY